MKILRALTVDDELLALRRLKLMLQAFPQVAHVGEASSCSEALAAIDQLAPDVVFLDIKMRDGDGFSVVEGLGTRPNPPVIIFVTAFDHYAVRAFEKAAVDYLLKPVERDRLAQAVRRALASQRAMEAENRISEMQDIIRNLRLAAGGRAQSPYESEFWLRGSGGVVRVALDTIECVSCEDDYVSLHSSAGCHLMRSSLRAFESRIEPGQFVRVHRRWLVRKAAIEELRTPRLGAAEVILRSTRSVPVGRVFLKSLKRSWRGSTPPAPVHGP
jgi:DNA-binding LytR/AlgR family response regulator